MQVRVLRATPNSAFLPPTGDSSKRLAAFVHFSYFSLKTFFQRGASIRQLKQILPSTSDSSTTAKERIGTVDSSAAEWPSPTPEAQTSSLSALLYPFIRHRTFYFQWKKTRYMRLVRPERILCLNNSLPMARFERKPYGDASFVVSPRSGAEQWLVTTPSSQGWPWLGGANWDMSLLSLP